MTTTACDDQFAPDPSSRGAAAYHAGLGISDNLYLSDASPQPTEAAHAWQRGYEAAAREAERQAVDVASLLAFRSAVTGWRENDWPEWFCRRTAEAVADRGRQAEENSNG